MADDDPSTRSPHALLEDYQRSSNSIHRRRLLRAMLDCGPPAAGAEVWLLLLEARALVAELCSIEEAGRLLLDHARNGGFPHYRGLVPDGSCPIDPRHWGSATISVHYPVDWNNSCVSYLRLEVSPYSVEGVTLDRLQGYLPGEPVLQMRLVRLPLHDVLALLHQHGLLPELPPLPGRSKLMASEVRDAVAISGTVPDASAPANPPTPQPKMRRADWIKAYLTKEKQSELSIKQVGKAAETVNRDMEADPRVNAYKNPRSIEPFLHLRSRRRSPT